MQLKRSILPAFLLVCCLLLSTSKLDTCLAGKEKGTAGNREDVRATPLSSMVCDTLYFGMSSPMGGIGRAMD